MLWISSLYEVATQDSDKWVGVAWPSELLSPLMDPEVGDPLSPGQDRTRCVSSQIVSFSILEQIIPEGCSSFLRPERDSQVWEHCGPSLLHI